MHTWWWWYVQIIDKDTRVDKDAINKAIWILNSSFYLNFE